MFKKIIYTIVSGSLMLSSCSLDRDPMNGPTSGTFPASEEEALSGVYAAYKGLSLLTVKETTFPTRINDCISDIGTYRADAGNQVKSMNSTLTSENAMVEKVYTYIYKVAGRVHLVLDNLDNLKGTVADETLDQFRAELLCIRAYYYDMGCQFFGAIPFIDHCLNLDDYAYPRMPREQVTERLLEDLNDELLDCLPVQWNPAAYGTTRIGRAAAYALKARIALNWGLWEEAARCAKKATTLAAGLYDLEPLDCTFYATHADGEPSAANLFGYEGQNSREWLWAVQHNKLISGNFTNAAYYEAARIHGGCSWLGPSQAMIDTFQCTDGKSIAESPLYDWQNPWANRDPRLDLFCLRPNTRLWGIQYDTDVRVEKVKDYNQSTSAKEVLIANSDAVGNKSEYAANGNKGPGGYLWRKYSDKTMLGLINGTKTEDDLNIGIIRFAELLLIEAEANIEWEGGDLQLAAADINRVRDRVNMPPVTDLSRAGLRKALRYERKVELCNEGFRWFDVRRWKIAPKAVNGPMYAPGYSTVKTPDNYISNAIPSFDDDWVTTYDTSRTWDGKAFNLRTFQTMVFNPEKDYLWPMPYTEMISNPAIGLENNNPGY